jgi:NAD(P) transhydrogenase
MSSNYDVIVIGCGPAGERAAIQAARAGKSVAVIERANVVGGTSVNWGTIPSKTLRESALLLHRLRAKHMEGFRLEVPERISISDFMYRERMVVQRELELINETLSRNEIEVFHGEARFVDANTVAVMVDGQSRLRLCGEIIVIATGTTPNRPAEVPFDGKHVFDASSILRMPEMPRSMLVLGAGVIGVEYAAIFSALGVAVTLVDTRPELLPYMDREIAGILERELRRLGMVLLHDDRHQRIEVVKRDEGRSFVRCHTKRGNLLEADALLYAVGRDGNTADLALEAIGIEPTSRGLLEVNERYQTTHSHIYAVGDVIGYPALASTSMEQGRQAIGYALDIDRPMTRHDLLPFAIYALPEVSYVGESEQSLRDKGVDYVVGRGHYDRNPRGQIINDTGGMLKLLFDRKAETLVGVHIVGTGASELIHLGTALMRLDCTALQLAEMPFNYPTLSDLYRHAAHRALKALGKRA